jgi:hypothetical protein
LLECDSCCDDDGFGGYGLDVLGNVAQKIDRKNNYYYIPIGVPQPQDLRRWQNDTVLDGELVLDVDEGGKKTLWFLLFDCMVCMGKKLVERPYHKRLGHLTEMVMKPYKKLLSQDARFAANQVFK